MNMISNDDIQNFNDNGFLFKKIFLIKLESMKLEIGFMSM